MLGWIYRFLIGRFTGCKHQWEIIEKTNRVYTPTGAVVGKRYTMQCSHCGEIKFKESY